MVERHYRKMRVFGRYDVIPHLSTRSLEVIYHVEKLLEGLRRVKSFKGDFFELCEVNNWQWDNFEPRFKTFPIKSDLNFMATIQVERQDKKRRYCVLSVGNDLYMGPVSLYDEIHRDIHTSLEKIQENYLKKVES